LGSVALLTFAGHVARCGGLQRQVHLREQLPQGRSRSFQKRFKSSEMLGGSVDSNITQHYFSIAAKMQASLEFVVSASEPNAEKKDVEPQRLRESAGRAELWNLFDGGATFRLRRFQKELNLSLVLVESEATNVIRLEGSIGIDSAAELKKLLILALESGKKVRVSLERATDLDVTAVQLLWAVWGHAKRSQVELALTEAAPEGISMALADAGFEKFLVSES
jgi:anti-anti-sigma regulatory factor